MSLIEMGIHPNKSILRKGYVRGKYSVQGRRGNCRGNYQ